MHSALHVHYTVGRPSRHPGRPNVMRVGIKPPPTFFQLAGKSVLIIKEMSYPSVFQSTPELPMECPNGVEINIRKANFRDQSGYAEIIQVFVGQKNPALRVRRVLRLVKERKATLLDGRQKEGKPPTSQHTFQGKAEKPGPRLRGLLPHGSRMFAKKPTLLFP